MTEDYREQRRGRERRTEVVDGDAAVGEASGGAVGVEVPPVGLAVGAGERAEVLVGANVKHGVADDEERGDERGGSGEEHQISMETVQRPEESPVELLDPKGERSYSIQMGVCVPDLTGGGAMRHPDPGSGGL